MSAGCDMLGGLHQAGLGREASYCARERLGRDRDTGNMRAGGVDCGLGTSTKKREGERKKQRPERHREGREARAEKERERERQPRSLASIILLSLHWEVRLLLDALLEPVCLCTCTSTCTRVCVCVCSCTSNRMQALHSKALPSPH